MICSATLRKVDSEKKCCLHKKVRFRSPVLALYASSIQINVDRLTPNSVQNLEREGKAKRPAIDLSAKIRGVFVDILLFEFYSKGFVVQATVGHLPFYEIPGAVRPAGFCLL
jgi:hypothetical protein